MKTVEEITTPTPPDCKSDTNSHIRRIMETITSNDKEFSVWAKQVYSQHPDILKHMRESTDTLERVIAVRIIKNAGVNEL